MNAMQVRFNKISSADFRGKSSTKPWKPEVTSPRRRGGSNRGREGRQFDNMWQNDRFTNSDSNGNQYGSNGQRNGNGTVRNRGKSGEILEVHSMVKVEDEVDLTKVQMLDAQE